MANAFRQKKQGLKAKVKTHLKKADRENSLIDFYMILIERGWQRNSRQKVLQKSDKIKMTILAISISSREGEVI
jgi:hypothetical protein